MVERGDVRLWSESRGSTENPVALLIMGANASAMGWPDEFVQRLVDGGLRVLRYDHRDTGRSSGPPFAENPYTITDLATDAVAVLNAWNVDLAHVVGLSMGGTLAQLVALDHPARVRSLCLMLGAALDVDFAAAMERARTADSSVDGLPPPRPEILDVLARRSEPATDRDGELDRRVAEWRALAGDRMPFDAEAFRRWEEQAIEHAGSIRQPVAHALATPAPLARGDELGRIGAPTLVIQGGVDPINPPPHGRHTADSIPGAHLWTVEGMGHALPPVLHQPLARTILAHGEAADRVPAHERDARPAGAGELVWEAIEVGGAPYGVAVDADRAGVWTTFTDTGEVARILVDMPAERHPIGGEARPTVLARGLDGAMWFARYGDHRIGRITATGEHDVVELSDDAMPYGVAVAPDGACWFTEMNGDRVGRIGPAGEITEFVLPVRGGYPAMLTVGPDGAMWCTLNQAPAIVRIGQEGAIAVHRLATTSSAPVGIAADAKALWYADIGAGVIGRMALDGSTREFPLPDRAARPHAVAVDPDGDVWFTEWATARLGRVTAEGRIVTYALPPGCAEPHGIACAPNGDVWVAAESGQLIRYRRGTGSAG